MKNIVVIGGGAAGMMAAIAALKNNNKVTLIERNEKLGKKLFITGKGRCNVTNACPDDEFFDSCLSNPKFLYSSIYNFSSKKLMNFFEENNCHLKIERGNRVFPVSDHSSDIIKCLEKILNDKKAIILKNSYVIDLEVFDNKISSVILKDGRKILCDSVILCTGGKSYSSTGSDGNGLLLAAKLGHKITDLKPGLVPIKIKEHECYELQGLSLKNINLTLYSANKKIYSGFGEMLFTHFGVSGPLVLSASSYMNKKTKGEECKLVIDLKAALTYEQLDKRLLRDFDEMKNKQLKNALNSLLPAKLIPVFINFSGIDPTKNVNEITKEERNRIVHLLKNFTFTTDGTRDFNEAIITIGGVSVKEVNPSTMESKIVKGLYFAGEILDLDALTGGFNLQIAWSTAYLAGSSV